MAEASDRKPAEILLVEDNPGDVHLIKEAFNAGDAAVTIHVAVDGEQAMQFLRREGPYAAAPRPDLVLLDLKLPRKSGHEVLAEIRYDENLRTIPVIVLTTSRAEKDVLRAYDLNCNCYIVKPVDLEEFTRLVEAINTFWVTGIVLPHRT